MKIVVDIPKAKYLSLKKCLENGIALGMVDIAILNGNVLPKGYGRLVDADALKKKAVMCPTVGNAETLLLDISDVESAPTIIEADKEGTNNGRFYNS